VSRFRIDHAHRPDLHAEAGHDPVLGFFVDVMREGRDRPVKSYDHFHPAFNRPRPLMGCLDFLASEGFFTGDELHDALIAIQDGEDNVPSGVQRTIEVVMQFKAAAD
jgi:hypothetical protein